MERVHTWYIEPIGDYTNKSISEMLMKEENASEKDAQIEGKTKRKKVWEVDYSLITKLKRSSVYFHFNVFVQEGKGIIRPFRFSKKMKKSPRVE